MANTINVWDGTEWKTLATALPVPETTSVAVSSNITMVKGTEYFVNTSAARTLTLPASPSLGDKVTIYDASNLAGTNNITINSNSGKINGTIQDAIIDINGGVNTLVYTGSTYGWRFI